MARWLTVVLCRCALHVLMLALFNRSTEGSENQILYMDGDWCERHEPIILGSATVYSHQRHENGGKFSHNTKCTLKFAAEKPGWTLMLKFEYLDIPDVTFNGICADVVNVYNSDTSGLRAFSAAGGQQGLCGSSPPAVLYSDGPYITLAFRTSEDGPTGTGFKAEVTAIITDAIPGNCNEDVFMCKANKKAGLNVCIDRELTCDRVNHCVDGSDEESGGGSQCSSTAEPDSFWGAFLSLGVAAQVGICVGCIIVLITVIVCIVFTCRRCGKKPGEPDQHRQSIPSSTHGSVQGAPQPASAGYKEGVTYQQAPVSHQQSHMMGPMMGAQYMQQGYYPMAAMQQPMAPIPQQRYVASHPLALDGHIQMGQMPQGVYNYNNSPLHMVRDPRESHSHSSGYSSQQGVPGILGYQPMHTKPIVPQTRAYTPTSGSRSSSRSGSSLTYSRGDHRHSHDRIRVPVAL